MKILIMILTGIGLWAPFWVVAYLDGRYVQNIWLKLIIIAIILIIPGFIWFGYLKPWFSLNF